MIVILVDNAWITGSGASVELVLHHSPGDRIGGGYSVVAVSVRTGDGPVGRGDNLV